ncbi:MAG: class I SAM-dependent methyltransferase [Candidatus Fermentibacteraceae bacterium]|nr:class I SAM-dependent methyltransferase [Candidatus Fermentibacteraceae bacterium]MBN2608300.1 class I SAM-dependent methyltransferase [Candidatus Fermentibacteraceae bacterium]
MIDRIRSHGDSRISAVGRALSDTLSGNLKEEDRESMGLIEQRRTGLLRSTDEIDVIDYGAGNPDSMRSKEEMAGGVHARRKVSDVCGASKPPFWCVFLYRLLRELGCSSCVELGSCVGISAAYQAAALNNNGMGTLRTLEGCPEIARLAEETIKGLGLENTTVITGPFNETLEGVLSESSPVDFFFNDGHHDHDAVLDYFRRSLPFLSREAVIVFDDISWSPGMRSAWTEIEEDDHVAASFDLGEIGIALIGSGSGSGSRFRIHLGSLMKQWQSPGGSE